MTVIKAVCLEFSCACLVHLVGVSCRVSDAFLPASLFRVTTVSSVWLRASRPPVPAGWLQLRGINSRDPAIEAPPPSPSAAAGLPQQPPGVAHVPELGPTSSPTAAAAAGTAFSVGGSSMLRPPSSGYTCVAAVPGARGPLLLGGTVNGKLRWLDMQTGLLQADVYCRPLGRWQVGCGTACAALCNSAHRLHDQFWPVL